MDTAIREPRPSHKASSSLAAVVGTPSPVRQDPAKIKSPLDKLSAPLDTSSDPFSSPLVCFSALRVSSLIPPVCTPPPQWPDWFLTKHPKNELTGSLPPPHAPPHTRSAPQPAEVAPPVPGRLAGWEALCWGVWGPGWGGWTR